ncbi:DUF6744 family protein [Kutzneria buriramensis]|uniref:Uncharacterized protein n=1 Tax=Kutzneria buriramensis TaxID=1045776 RepID=A0A3E0GXQ7_9PSEU|nr:DUF6744 family protein [Kutzneria buriramensis]REH31054.1 hypothetical protein BCF44_12277 [Kutzneria buriramensis]
MAPQQRAEADQFASYAEALEAQQTPLLGYLVLYSVFDGEVTLDKLTQWFRELDLDLRYLPPPLRNIDAFERVTGRKGPTESYPLDDPTSPEARRRLRKGGGAAEKVATLLIRPVSRDPDRVVRHLVREVRDERAEQLSYDTHLGYVVFERDTSNASLGDGMGAINVAPDNSVIKTLPEAEQTVVRQLLDEVSESYQRLCVFLSADKLRSLLRNYIEDLGALRVRPTGGVYFVHRQHADTLAALRTLVSRFGGRSQLARIPLPDQDEMRELIIASFTSKATDELQKLAMDIAEARGANATDAEKQALYRRFTALKDETAEHSELLSTSLDDAESALQLVQLQLTSLLAGIAPTPDDDDDDE